MRTAVKTLREMVAYKLERDPALLRIPLENIDRWLANGHTATHRLQQWREIILRAQASSTIQERYPRARRPSRNPAGETRR